MAVGGLLLLVLLLGVVVGLIWPVLRGRARPKVHEPSCGRCGYRVRGLPTFTCPECGADLREVGIVTPWQHRGMGRWARAGIWTIAFAILAYLADSVLAWKFLPLTIVQTSSLVLRDPGSGRYGAVEFQAEGAEWQWGRTRSRNPAPDKLTVQLTLDSGPSRELNVDLASLSCRYHAADGKSERPPGVDAETVLDWMRACGIEEVSDGLRAEAGAIAGVIRNARQARLRPPDSDTFRGRWVTTGPTYRRTPSLPYVRLAFWMLMWLMGLLFFLRRPREQASAANPERD